MLKKLFKFHCDYPELHIRLAESQESWLAHLIFWPRQMYTLLLCCPLLFTPGAQKCDLCVFVKSYSFRIANLGYVNIYSVTGLWFGIAGVAVRGCKLAVFQVQSTPEEIE